MARVRAASTESQLQDTPRSPCDDAEALNEEDEAPDVRGDRVQDPVEEAVAEAQVDSSDARQAGFHYSLGVTLAALATAYFIHYYIHAGAVSASSPSSSAPHTFRNPLKGGLAGPFDVELEKAEMCDKERQGLGAAKMEYSSVTLDKDVPKRYHISGRGYFNYNTSDDLSAKFLLASWNFPGRWITYYSNTFSGGCSMAKNFSPERWRRMSQMVFGHENADCPFPPVSASPRGGRQLHGGPQAAELHQGVGVRQVEGGEPDHRYGLRQPGGVVPSRHLPRRAEEARKAHARRGARLRQHRQVVRRDAGAPGRSAVTPPACFASTREMEGLCSSTALSQKSRGGIILDSK
ncbi:uncharacterized protein LOC113211167 isoform X1 [Frankliniella occidentalis]|uniref:Uncharacterized protein LOC113211167 isoform X1 n=1 Tax=Frankliniella occidentalis TaxID=133901 RepID=A0A6J1SVE7_FRAOC|nr:uncharacterized protein LOC113211167 isoform X1 [Frankliniella occidentalis]